MRPDGAGVSYSYDNNGNMTVLVNPNLVSHGFSYTATSLRTRLRLARRPEEGVSDFAFSFGVTGNTYFRGLLLPLR